MVVGGGRSGMSLGARSWQDPFSGKFEWFTKRWDAEGRQWLCGCLLCEVGFVCVRVCMSYSVMSHVAVAFCRVGWCSWPRSQSRRR